MLFSRRQFLRTGALGAVGGLWSQAVGAAVVKTPLREVSLAFLPAALTVIRRSDWRSAKPKAWLLREADGFDRVTVHHQGGQICRECAVNAVMADIDAVFAGHFTRRYGDIGYHFVIDYAGRVWEGRSLAYEGAHVENQNRGNIGVLLLGNYEAQAPSDAAVQALAALVHALRGQCGIKRHRVYGHRDLGASVCPGKQLYPYVGELREGDLVPDDSGPAGAGKTTTSEKEAL
jgi:hypothetical protein